MRWLPFLPLIAAALLVNATPLRAADSDCIKEVFGQYCLGGETAQFQLTAVAGQDGVFTDDNGHPNTALTVRAGRLVAVERRVHPAGWREYDDWKKRLERIYRSGENASTFPRYAASRSSQLNAIRSGRGSARTDWRLDGWTLSLIWRETDAIHLRYALRAADGDQLTEDEL